MCVHVCVWGGGGVSQRLILSTFLEQREGEGEGMPETDVEYLPWA